jgi:hypothetical protein
MRVGVVQRLQLEGWLYRDCKHLLHHLDAATMFELLQDNSKGRQAMHQHVVTGRPNNPVCRCRPWPFLVVARSYKCTFAALAPLCRSYCIPAAACAVHLGEHAA